MDQVLKIPLFNKTGRMVAAATIDADDPYDIQVFRWRVDAYGYAVRSAWRNIDNCTNRMISMHRHAMDCVRGDGKIVDHINGDKLDNRRCNLRFVDLSDNGHNCGLWATNTSGFRNVHRRLRDGKFVAMVARRCQTHYLGAFDTAEQAAVVVSDWRKRHIPILGGAA